MEKIISATIKIITPLIMSWEPKEDITAYELARCLPYFFSESIMPGDIDKSLSYFRHFNILDPNI